MTIRRYKRRFWAVFEPDGRLLCVCVYRKGACSVVRRLWRMTVRKRAGLEMEVIL